MRRFLPFTRPQAIGEVRALREVESSFINWQKERPIDVLDEELGADRLRMESSSAQVSSATGESQCVIAGA
jgi:hypothetical protein